MAVRELRVCDVCETNYTEDNAAWMIMSAVNAPPEMGRVEYDFCSFDCLHSFVNSPDEEETDEVPVDEDPIETDAEAEAGLRAELEYQQRLRVAEADARTIAQEQPRPAMTLMDAIAMGAKPGFDPIRDGQR